MTEAPRASGLCEAKRPLPYRQRRASSRRAAATRLFLLAIATFLPAACATTIDRPSAPAEAAAQPASRGAVAAQAVAADVQPSADAGAPILATAGSATTVAVALDLERLHGLSVDDLRTMLGTPDFRRHDAAAEIWQYRGGGCILDLFLYRETGGYRVSYAETRDAGLLRGAPAGCLSTVVASRRSLHASNDTY